MSFREFTNTLNTVAFSSLSTQLCWVFGSVVLTVVDAHLFVAEKGGAEFLAGALLGAWLGKSVSGVVSSELKRSKDQDYTRVKGEAAVALAKANQGKVTVQNVEQVTVTEEPKREHPD